MSQSRIHDLVLLLAGGLVALPGCTDREPIDPDDDGGASAGVDPQQEDQLEDAIEACKPYARRYAECYAGGGPNPYVSFVGYCVASIGYAVSESPACGDAYADYFACLGALDCDALVGDDDGEESGGPDAPEPCEAEIQAVEAACAFEDGDDDEDGG